MSEIFQTDEPDVLTCEQCRDKFSSLTVDKCCDQNYCLSCKEFNNKCEHCKKDMCDSCADLRCYPCEQANGIASVCGKCIRSCFHCKTEYCPEHVVSTLHQLEPCLVCEKTPCTVQDHPKQRMAKVLSCFDCLLKQTKEKTERKKATVDEKKMFFTGAKKRKITEQNTASLDAH